MAGPTTRRAPAPRPVLARRRRALPVRKGERWVLWDGRVQTSTDAPYVLVVTAVILLALPACWLAWEAPYLARAVSVAPVVLFCYFWASTLAAMVYV